MVARVPYLGGKRATTRVRPYEMGSDFLGNNEYSKRLGKISPSQFQAALDRFDLGTFLHAKPTLSGLFGQNVFVSSTKGEFVLRGNPHFPWQFPTEQFFVQMLYERTSVPVPFPYHIDVSTDIFGWSYVLMPRMKGIQIADADVKKQLSREDRLGIARALGESLAAIQELTWPFPGRYSVETDTIQPFELLHELAWPFPIEDMVFYTSVEPTIITFSERIVAHIRHMLAGCCAMNDHTTASDGVWVEKMLALAEDALDVPFQPCVVMEDYKPANTVLEYTDGMWRVSGVFDLMEAHFGDGEADLSRTVAMYLMEDPQLAREFVQAYFKGKPPRAGFAERFSIYMLHDRLIIWEYLQRNAPEALSRWHTFQEWAMPYASCLIGLE